MHSRNGGGNHRPHLGHDRVTGGLKRNGCRECESLQPDLFPENEHAEQLSLNATPLKARGPYGVNGVFQVSPTLVIDSNHLHVIITVSMDGANVPSMRPRRGRNATEFDITLTRRR